MDLKIPPIQCSRNKPPVPSADLMRGSALDALGSKLLRRPYQQTAKSMFPITYDLAKLSTCMSFVFLLILIQKQNLQPFVLG